jgi:hypothetical protein
LPVDIGAPFTPKPIATTQVYEGARDLDIKPAIAGEKVQVCRVFPKAGTPMSLKLDADTAHWTNSTSVTVTINDPTGTVLGSHVFNNNNRGASFSVQPTKPDFHSIVIEAENTPPQNEMPSYSLAVTYMAPQTL